VRYHPAAAVRPPPGRHRRRHPEPPPFSRERGRSATHEWFPQQRERRRGEGARLVANGSRGPDPSERRLRAGSRTVVYPGSEGACRARPRNAVAPWDEKADGRSRHANDCGPSAVDPRSGRHSPPPRGPSRCGARERRNGARTVLLLLCQKRRRYHAQAAVGRTPPAVCDDNSWENSGAPP